MVVDRNMSMPRSMSEALAGRRFSTAITAGIDPRGEVERNLSRLSAMRRVSTAGWEDHIGLDGSNVQFNHLTGETRVAPLGLDVALDPWPTHRVFVIREVSTEIKFTPRDGETEHDAFLRVCEERGITGVIRHSEPRKV